jgi:hypothetical protein
MAVTTEDMAATTAATGNARNPTNCTVVTTDMAATTAATTSVKN